ncbi:MAG: cell division protein ZapE [Gammaproteobacteria bacterium]|nr:cell division protein ZapE [Gammaproteobacteria bacterium]
MTPRERYRADIARGALRPDAAQAQALDVLQQLYETLAQTPPAPTAWWARLFDTPRRAVRGLYLWGGPGRGKTYLIDSFFECLPFPQKRRVHFHLFMQEIHAQLRSLPHTPNPLRVVGRRMAEQWRVLCLDEFHVHDIADAMLLAGLLQALFDAGITLVATSNVAPDALYLEGLQRDRFLFAIDLLKTHTTVLHLDSPVDFRCELLDRGGTYHVLDGDAGRAILARDFRRLAPVEAAYDQVLMLHQRPVPVLAIADDVIWFRFADVCDAPLWARDYLEIARRYHSVFLSDIPRMDEGRDDAAKRFMHLIDALYDHNVKLVATAEAVPEHLYSGRYLQFAFQRTVSRLAEMGSHRYLAKPHR